MSFQALEQALADVIEPLVRADRGELYVVQLSPQAVSLHLRGQFSGCPGNALVIRQVIEPVVNAAAPDARVTVSAGETLPEQARSWKDYLAATASARSSADQSVE